MTAKDDNERLKQGTLPCDPFDDTVPVGKPLPPAPKPIPRLWDAISAGVRMALKGKPTNPLRTGFAELDAGLQIFGPKEITMLAADSGVGKSTLSTQAALHAAMAGYGVAYMNLEMAHEMYGLRTIANYTKVPVKLARVGDLTSEHHRRMTGALADMRVAGQRIALGNPNEHRTSAAIVAFCKDAAQVLEAEGTPLALVVIDHVLQVMVNVRNDKDAEGKARADLLKTIAETLNVHVLALVHITREGSKSGAMPTKNQLASSAWFDRHADNILIFHQKRNANGIFAGGKATLACQKARWGDPFAIELEYQGGFFYPWLLTESKREHATFEDLEEQV